MEQFVVFNDVAYLLEVCVVVFGGQGAVVIEKESLELHINLGDWDLGRVQIYESADVAVGCLLELSQLGPYLLFLRELPVVLPNPSSIVAHHDGRQSFALADALVKLGLVVSR